MQIYRVWIATVNLYTYVPFLEAPSEVGGPGNVLAFSMPNLPNLRVPRPGRSALREILFYREQNLHKMKHVYINESWGG